MKNIYTFFIVALAFACSNSAPAPSESSSPSPTTEPAPTAVKLIDSFALKGLLLLEDEIFQGRETVHQKLSEWQSTGSMPRAYQTEGVVRHDSLHYFTYGYYAGKGQKFRTVIAWEIIKGKAYKEIEIIYPMENNAPENILRTIDQRRADWVRLSNAHDHEALVKDLYAADGYYFNQKKLAKGTQAISERYQYMSTPKWQISLKGLKVIPVNEQVVFEIGEYRSGGVGHYIITWQLQDDGRWQVLLDFNF